MRMAQETVKITKREMAAIALAAIAVIAAIVVVCGIVLGGWLSPISDSGAVNGSADEASVVQSNQNNLSNTQANESSNANLAASAGNASEGAGETAATAASNQSDGNSQNATMTSSSLAAPADSADSTTGAGADQNATASTDTADQQAASSSASDTGASAAVTDGTSSNSTSASNDKASSDSAATKITVTLTIDSSRAHTYNTAWPESMGSYTLTLADGDSVYDALVATGVAIGGDSTYVRSINGLAEFACGTRSGWVYHVDGESPSKGCGRYQLNGGERIEWIYTCDYIADGL